MLETLPRFPCAINKRPLTGHGFLDAALDVDDAQWPLVGVPTGSPSGFDVLDIDPRNGGNLWRQQHELPATRVHWTKGGGRHFLFRHSGLRLRKSIADGVDLKGDGGYVIWWPREGLRVEDHPIAEWPEWLRAEIGKAEKSGGCGAASPSMTRDQEARSVSLCRVIIRDPTERSLHWAACRFSEMIAWGYPSPRALKMLEAAAEYSGLTRAIGTEAVRRTIDNGLSVVDRRVDGLLRTLASAYPGNRNNTLYWVSIEVSRLTPRYEELLIETAISLGLNLSEIKKTINSAVN
jgi:hypothetical protein